RPPPLDLRPLLDDPRERELVRGGPPPVEYSGASQQRCAGADRGYDAGLLASSPDPVEERLVRHFLPGSEAARDEQAIEWRTLPKCGIGDCPRPLRALDRAGPLRDRHHPPAVVAQTDVAERLERPEDVEQLEGREEQDAERPTTGIGHAATSMWRQHAAVPATAARTITGRIRPDGSGAELLHANRPVVGSRNDGDSWSCIASSLPPAYSLRPPSPDARRRRSPAGDRRTPSRSLLRRALGGHLLEER